MSYRMQRVALAATLIVVGAGALPAQKQTLAAKIAEISARPEFVHATFGVAAYDLDAKKMLFGLNAEQLFTPGSTTKLLTTGTALALLGPDHRFHTPVYRTGPVDRGVLKGDLVLVGVGDPNLSGRAIGDTLGFANEDHSYTGGGDSVAKVIGDPLAAMRDLAGQIAARGIKQVDGRVLVDVSLFPQGERELGTGVVISPIVLNDNVVDLLLEPGGEPGEHAIVRASPDLGMFTVANELMTGAAHTTSSVQRMVTRDSSGNVTVRLVGSYAADAKPMVMSVNVNDPADYAARALVAALRDRGVTVAGGPGASRADFARLSATYADSTRLAEHVSLPLREEIKAEVEALA